MFVLSTKKKDLKHVYKDIEVFLHGLFIIIKKIRGK